MFEPRSAPGALHLNRAVPALRRVFVPGFSLAIVAALALDVFHRQPPIGIDFHTYVAASTVGLQHGWSHIYDQGLVAGVQRDLVPWERAQPYLSPPPVAWLVAPFQALPYTLAFELWAALLLAALVLALAWTTTYRGTARVVAVAAAVVPWWVSQALMVGQVVPLIAVGILVAWRLLRDDHDVAAGLVLGLVLLKPNTALLAPVALLAAGRIRAFTAWLAVAAAAVSISVLTLGPDGSSAYVAGLIHLPSGANHLTLSGTFGLAGIPAIVVRAVIVAGALATAYRYRAQPGLALVVGALASLLVAPYLHASDLCVLVSVGWILWHERPEPFLRAVVAAGWLMSTALNVMIGLGPPLDRWLIFELLLAIAVAAPAWWPSRRKLPLTGEAELGRHAPA